jgi:NADPH-dependent F420 reductase
MRIAIIGAGNVGKALAKAAAAAGHDVVVSATDPDHARAAAEPAGGTAAGSNAEAVHGADLVVLAVPYRAVSAVADEIAAHVAGTAVVDATNPMREDLSGHAVSGRSGAEEVQAALPGAHVVKAFNTVLAGNMAAAVVDGVRLDGFYAGDDEGAKEVVDDLLNDLGFRPVDAGPLPAALALEHLALLNIGLNVRLGWPWRTGWRLVGPGPEPTS